MFDPLPARSKSTPKTTGSSTLFVGRVNDPLEREARRAVEDALATPARPALPANCISDQPDGEVVPAPDSVHRVLGDPGRPLEPALKQDMERRFGHDFSRVRVHTDAAASQATRSLRANAFTVGHDLVFGAGQFVPGTNRGRRLIAHELTHVVQQSSSSGMGVSRGALDAILVQRDGELSALPPIVLGLLTGMDVQGETILGTYLYGGGKPHDVEDPIWTEYMMEHRSLRGQIFSHLVPLVREVAARKQKGRFPIVDIFHAEFPENSGFSGYALLHGSNRDVGDFKLLGWAEVQDAIDPKEGDYDIELDLRFVFNDIVDPNPKYFMDRVRSAFADIVTLGQPRSYRLSIHWSSSCLAEVRDGGQTIHFSGYPSENQRIPRPLPGATLDWVRLEKERAQKIEAQIIRELQRGISAENVSAVAARKQKLLWLFYGLSGYMGSTYYERLSEPRSDDELPRLFRERLSRELRAQLIEALLGRRPRGENPALK